MLAGDDTVTVSRRFHSFAFDGPMFHHPITVEVGEIVDRDNFVFADIKFVERARPAEAFSAGGPKP